MSKTLLYDWHIENGAQMAEFAGFQMPLWYYAGAVKEHLSVLQGSGLFDTSHMASIIVNGRNAFSLLQHCFSRNISHLASGRCVYGVFLNSNGCVIDDAIIYRFSDSHFMVVVNAGNGGIIASHLEKNNEDSGTIISDLTGTIGKLDIQGPNAPILLSKLINSSDLSVEDLKWFSFIGSIEENSSKVFIDKIPILISRTGYTGEVGFEVFVKAEYFIKAWEIIYTHGQKTGLLCCGLAARDSLRTGATLPLSGQDIGPFPFINNPWEFTLPFNHERNGFTKEFIGGTTLLSISDSDRTYPFTGFDPRKIPAGGNSFVLNNDGKKIGTLLTCVTDMGIGRIDNTVFSINSPDKPASFTPKGLSCGFVKVNNKLRPGDIVYLSDGKRKIKAEITQKIRPDLTAYK